MKHSATIHKNTVRRGSTLIMAIIFLLAISILVISVFDRSTRNIAVTSRRINDPVTTTIAESGIEKAVWCLNNVLASATDCPKNGQGQYVGESNVVFGRGMYTTVVSVSGSTATVTATATTTGLGGGSSKQIQVELTQAASLDPAFQYGVQTGEGGITMSNNASIVGNVYTNGSITGSNGSSVTGDAVLAVSSPTADAIADPAVIPLLTKNLGDASNTVYLAQKFVAGYNDSVYSIDLKLAKHGVAPPAITAYVYTDNNGTPGSNISGSGQSLNAAFPFDSPGGWENGWTTQIFGPSSILLQNTSYWLVLKASSSNSTKYWTTVRAADDTTYGSGTAKIGADLASLGGLGYDIAFRVNVGGQAPTLSISNQNNGTGIGGNAYSHNINDTYIKGDAYYQALSGSVKANNATTTCSLTPNANCHPASADQPPQNFPISDAQIAQMETIAAAGGVVTCSPVCTLTDGSSIGPKEYVGNVQITDNGAIINLTGTVWIKGNFTMSNSVVLKLDPGYGTDNGIIIADDPDNLATGGTITFSNNGDLSGSSNASCTGIPKRCSDGINKNNSCSVATDCPFNSIMAISKNSDPTLATSAISVANNLSAGVLYAPYGLVSITNNASLKEVTAQRLSLANGTTVKYMTGLASAIFSSGPGASWQLKPGTYHIIE